MDRSERGWVRGAIVIGLAGAMMAVALLSPALAVRLATTGYVKQKINTAINQLRGEAANSFIEDGLSYVRTPSVSVASGNFAVVSIACPAGTNVTGGGAAVGDLTIDNSELEASYPSNGSSSGGGTTGWTTSVENSGPAPFNASTYAICAKSSGSASYPVGGAPAKAGASSGTYEVVTGRH